MPLSGEAAVAVQTSASPDWPLARFTSFQVRPPPLTVTLCLPAPLGPSLPTNASRTSPGVTVPNAEVVTLPWPCTDTEACSTKQVIAGGGFWTVTGTPAAVPVLPLVSV